MNPVAYCPRGMQTIVATNQCLRFIWGDPTLIHILLGGWWFCNTKTHTVVDEQKCCSTWYGRFSVIRLQWAGRGGLCTEELLASWSSSLLRWCGRWKWTPPKRSSHREEFSQILAYSNQVFWNLTPTILTRHTVPVFGVNCPRIVRRGSTTRRTTKSTGRMGL